MANRDPEPAEYPHQQYSPEYLAKRREGEPFALSGELGENIDTVVVETPVVIDDIVIAGMIDTTPEEANYGSDG